MPTYERFGLSLGHLHELTGIRERRFFAPHVTPAGAATVAAQKALERCGRSAAEVGVVISTSVDREFFEPSNACFVHRNLGMEPSAHAFDVSNACMGFIDGLCAAANLIELSQVGRALVVAGEASGVRTSVESALRRLGAPDASEEDLARYFANLTVGCGAVAFVLARKELVKNGGHSLDWALARTDTRHNQLCLGEIIGQDNFLLRSNGGGLLRYGVGLIKETWAQAKATFDAATFAHAFGHQVAAPHTALVIKALDAGPDQYHMVYDFLGNVGPAGLPISVALTAEQGKLAAGDRVVLVGVGSGLTSAIVGVRW